MLHNYPDDTMSRRVSDLFSEDDLARIKKAVGEAEQSTSAEIVPFIVDHSDGYDEALWRSGLLVGVVLLGLFWILRLATPLWNPLGLGGTVAGILGAIVLVMICVRTIPGLTRLFAGKDRMKLRTIQRAQEAFLDEEIFATQARTGILIFVSILERQVIVLGDSGVNKHVSEEEWHGLRDQLVMAIRSGRAGKGMVEAIHKSGHLLEQHGLIRKADDRNELPDRPRTEDRR